MLQTHHLTLRLDHTQLFIQVNGCIQKIVPIILFAGDSEFSVYDHHLDAFLTHL